VLKSVIVRDLFGMVQDGLLDPLHFINFTIHALDLKISNHASVVVQLLSLAIFILNNFIYFENQNNPKSILFTLISGLITANTSIKETLINYLLDIINTSSVQQIELIARSMVTVKESKFSDDVKERMLNLESICSVIS
jgi:hypothetical protein